MTSSLVGSEMCIRDRLWELSDSVPHTPPFCVGRPCRIGTRKRTADTGTVSYTHLTLPTICSV
eukprot:4697579-Prorocentrum_lima.AAC.1